jgi:hypothetical protein
MVCMEIYAVKVLYLMTYFEFEFSINFMQKLIEKVFKQKYMEYMLSHDRLLKSIISENV